MKVLLISIILFLTASCETVIKTNVETVVQLPFLKNTSSECYYLDEFMPMPDALVTGESGSLKLRYYTYKAANYKDKLNTSIVLYFYSDNNKCWSLFEEYFVVE